MPQHLGFGHFFRDEVTASHYTRPLTQDMFSSGCAGKTPGHSQDLHLHTEVEQLQLFPTILLSQQAQASSQANDVRHNLRAYCVCPRTTLSGL